MTHTNNKFLSMRKVIQLSATFFMLILISISCKKKDTNIGDTLQGESLNVSTTDTFTLLTYSDEIDSMESDETSISMLGYYVDPVFGAVDCGIVTQLRLSSPVTSFGNPADIVVDSVVLGLRYSSINYYANLQDITVEVYEVSDLLVRDDQTYYTFQAPNTTGGNLVVPGTEVLTPDYVGQQILANGDTLAAHLRIKLDPALGQAWLTDHNSAWTTESDFISYFKGLYIKANGAGITSGEGTVLYFAMEDALSNVTVYYHDIASPTVLEEFEFSVNSTAARYNYITYDRTGTAVEAVLNDPAKGQEAFYLQGSALRAIIEIPYIMDFNYDAEGNYDPKILNRATLILPIQDYTLDPYDPATSLFIARIVDDKLSDFTIDYNFGGSLSSSTVKYDEDEKEFRFSVTRELQAILNGEIENNGFRLYMPAFFASTIERIIFNGANTTLKEKPRLEITYTDY